ncbi:MAG: hypothetical protein HYT22_03110 [Candidatus Niyogibacteria bacterium]|nr:hypothetical protein [Candidatus Niyogibacteria bacterium]
MKESSEPPFLIGGGVIKKTTVFPVACDESLTGGELLALGKYDWVHRELRRRGLFGIRSPEFRTPKIYMVEIHEFDEDLYMGEVFDRFKEMGLERPTIEASLRFGAYYPDEQKKRAIVFPLDKPIESRNDGANLLFVLSSDGSYRVADVEWMGCCWPAGTAFAAVRQATAREAMEMVAGLAELALRPPSEY